MPEYLFYDIEVFKHDSLIVFKDINKNIVRVVHNDTEQFKALAELTDGS